MNKQRENIYALRRRFSRARSGCRTRTARRSIDTREYLMTLAEDMLDAHGRDLRAARGATSSSGISTRSSARSSRVFAIDTERRSTSTTAPPTRSATSSGTQIARIVRGEGKLVGREVLQRVERDIMLQIVDQQWKDHLYSLDHLKEGIGLRGYGQRDPLVEYKKESFELFQAMKERVDEEIVRYLWWLRPVLTEEAQPAPVPRAPGAAPRAARS